MSGSGGKTSNYQQEVGEGGGSGTSNYCLEQNKSGGRGEPLVLALHFALHLAVLNTTRELVKEIWL